MERKTTEIPLPSYWQWTTETVLPGCVAIVIYFAVCSLLLFRHIQITWVRNLEILAIGCTVGYLPVIVITLRNTAVCVAWVSRIGRVITWNTLWDRVYRRSAEYEILVKPIFRGGMSFGTYWTYGGWSAYILRETLTGASWVVVGRAPGDLAE